MELIEIDGSLGEGGGQILRTAVSLACILGKNVRIYNIRAGRREPGLRPQHLNAISASAEISNAVLKGGKIGSTEIELIPGAISKKVSKRIDTGTAGSISLIAQTLIPIAMLREIDLEAEIIGGTEVSASPTVDYIDRVAIPAYREMGGNLSIQLKQRGYYPRGGGRVLLKVMGSKSSVRPLFFPETRVEAQVSVISVSRNLPEHISSRQLSSAEEILHASGITNIRGELDFKGEALSPGTSVLVCSQSESSYIGSDVLGERGKRSEQVGSDAAQAYLSELRTRPNVDAHLADMIVTFLSCIPGKSHFSTSRVTQHLRTNLDVSRKLTGCEHEIREDKEKGNWEVLLSGLAEKSN